MTASMTIAVTALLACMTPALANNYYFLIGKAFVNGPVSIMRVGGAPYISAQNVFGIPSNAGAALYDLKGRTYVVGGQGTRAVTIINAGANSTSQLPPLPNEMSGAAIGHDLQGLLLICGGKDHGGNPTSRCYAYNGGWLSAPSLPQPLKDTKMVSTRFGSYIFGGYSETTKSNSNQVWRIRTANGGQWEPMAAMPTAMASHCALMITSTDVLVCGNAPASYYCYLYSLTANTWRQAATMKYARMGCAIVPDALGGAYILGGNSANVVEHYHTSTGGSDSGMRYNGFWTDAARVENWSV